MVTGSDGLLGTNILPPLQERFDVIPYVETQWDITDYEKGKDVLRQHAPDVLVNLAAITDVDGCEDRPDTACAVNGEGVGTLAHLCKEHGTAFVHLSTDYVFDGTKTSPFKEDDAPNPLSVYGRSKLLGEQRAVQHHPSPLIIRTEWIYGRGGRNFVTKVVEAGRTKGSVEVVDDQRGSPTFAADLAAPIASLIEKGMSGIYHVTNSGSCTWFEFAQHIFSLLGLDVVTRPISSDHLARKARRPSNSVLDCSKMTADTGVSMRSWEEALEEYLTCFP